MAFGYIIGIALYGVLFMFGMKIMNYIDPKPPHVPNDSDDVTRSVCSIIVSGKTYKCVKTVITHKTYSYDEDLNLVETEWKHIQFELNELYLDGIRNYKVIVCEIGREPIECYITKDLKSFISYNAITSERIREYRKSWKNKRLTATR